MLQIPSMKTLRRSCAACAKAKLRCNLRTPKCSRCVKRNSNCVYANEPLTSGNLGADYIRDDSPPQVLQSHKSQSSLGESTAIVPSNLSETSLHSEAHLFDPFDSYPPTNLPRLRVQGLMRRFLSKIAFEYYPLDLFPVSNPFIVSWWPLALTDPALFHVTLQTASWDDELQAKNGFPHSELLMKDSVTLLRHRIQDRSFAFQDATLNAVVTLAAIEHGKGNLQVSRMHIEGVKAMVSGRGGISEVKETSPLTARMVLWVSLLVMGSPQFEPQYDLRREYEMCVVPQPQINPALTQPDEIYLDFSTFGLDPSIHTILARLRAIFCQPRMSKVPENLSTQVTEDLHDLTCFVLHCLLVPLPLAGIGPQSTAISECLRYGTSIYMFIIHGPTYYSHAHILSSLIIQLKYHLEPLLSSDKFQQSLRLWLLVVGTVASVGTNESHWFREQASEISAVLGLSRWDDIERHLKRVLWWESRSRAVFRQAWEETIASNSSLQVLALVGDVRRSMTFLGEGT